MCGRPVPWRKKTTRRKSHFKTTEDGGKSDPGDTPDEEPLETSEPGENIFDEPQDDFEPDPQIDDESPSMPDEQ